MGRKADKESERDSDGRMNLAKKTPDFTRVIERMPKVKGKKGTGENGSETERYSAALIHRENRHIVSEQRR